MGHATMVKNVLLAILVFHLISFLTGCKPEEEEEARRTGDRLTSDSAGWERLRQQDALPPELKDKRTGPTAPIGPVSREWRVKKDDPTAQTRSGN
ncbi:hypothetical protein SAE02_69670 [Skermanella aerolata]|uniref:Uncharacterized protein n=1 Tax=Skermanella aerolata TaxID=393310 RepID=A0A512E263_9PROT|nr:hypothetical protein [Skermanella aerolata]KJB91241.1 hypothetical protein N826_31415 [Skermanella aerolata KACC 11604]GEO42819.1 hypothetical protein SAE02_69670 [Skermanella aerolata]